MRNHALMLASALIFVSSAAVGQQKFDSLGMPTPALNQKALPNETPPNQPIPGDKLTTTGKAATDGSGSSTKDAAPSSTTTNATNPDPAGVNGTTPGGLTPD